MKPTLEIKKGINNSEYEELLETNGNKRIKMKGMRSEDIATILTSENFKEFKKLQSDQQEAHEEGCKFILDFSYC